MVFNTERHVHWKKQALWHFKSSKKFIFLYKMILDVVAVLWKSQDNCVTWFGKAQKCHIFLILGNWQNMDKNVTFSLKWLENLKTWRIWKIDHFILKLRILARSVGYLARFRPGVTEILDNQSNKLKKIIFVNINFYFHVSMSEYKKLE